MDMELFGKIILFFISVGIGILMIAGIKADRGQSTWATKCQLFAGIGLFLSMMITLAVISADEFVEDAVGIFLALILGVTALVFTIGTIGFCARFGATCRRITQLEEIESALSAAVAHSQAQTPATKEQSS